MSDYGRYKEQNAQRAQIEVANVRESHQQVNLVCRDVLELHRSQPDPSRRTT
jgi:hypothetical protein